LVHKANRTEASHAVAFSHTAALADDDRIVDAAFRQAGILRAQGFRDMTAMAKGLKLPPVRGNELVIISRSGGHAVVAADLAERHGFRLPELPDGFRDTVQGRFRADVIALTNPLDLGVIFDFEIYAQIVEGTLRALSPDAILLINTYSFSEAQGAEALAQRVAQLSTELGRPVAFCVYSHAADLQALQSDSGMPIFDDIDSALRALAASRHWERARAARCAPTSNRYSEHASRRELKGAGEPLTLDTVEALERCRRYGIPTPPWEVVGDPVQAPAAAARIGTPVAVKALAPELVHKSDRGGVRLGLEEGRAIEAAAHEMLGRFEGLMSQPRLLVQAMAPKGVEVILGGKLDPSFGPVVMLGIGGIFVELYEDVTFRVTPLTEADAKAMVEELRGRAQFRGFRGAPSVDEAALIESILALSRLMIEDPRMTEFEVNPLILTAQGAWAVDGRGKRLPS
jgi:acetyltransferase